jgi:two-component system cell cycle sensor histidine kinase/response regulator CckA
MQVPADQVGHSHCVGLVVDDDDLVRENVVAILEALCDEVYAASDGLEGLRVLHDHPDITVIVTDIAMPQLDGIGFIKQARRQHPDLKVLFLSGLQAPPQETFLAKPFMARALVAAVNQLLAPH